MKIDVFLTDENRKTIKSFYKELKKKKYENEDSMESGGLGLRKVIIGDAIMYEIYRLIGYVEE